MKKVLLEVALLVVAACLFPGCLVLSMQPAYDAESLEVDETLVGKWQAQDQPATVVVERGEWKSYRINYSSRNTSYALTGYITKIGDALFIDVTPLGGLEGVPLMVPAHGIARLQHTGDTVTIAALDWEWFTADARAKTVARLAPALDARQNLLLTCKTPVLRAWLLANLKTADAFREPVVFRRLPQ